jgi:hypothetical protein
VRRREFITLLGGATAWPFAARGQQQLAMPVVGFLRNTTAPPFAHLVTELGKGLSEEGFVEGRNVIIEQRWGDNQPDRLPGLAADLVRRKAAVSLKATAHHAGRGSVTWRIASGRREREGMDAGIGAKATVLDCMGGDGEGICASLQA